MSPSGPDRVERRRAADAKRQRQRRQLLVGSGTRELRLRVPEGSHDALRDLCQRAVANDAVLAALVAASDAVGASGPPPPAEPPRRPAPAVEAAAALLQGVVAPLPRPLAPAARQPDHAPAASVRRPTDRSAAEPERDASPPPVPLPAPRQEMRHRGAAVLVIPVLVAIGILGGGYVSEVAKRSVLEAELDRYAATLIELLDEVAAYGRACPPTASVGRPTDQPPLEW